MEIPILPNSKVQSLFMDIEKNKDFYLNGANQIEFDNVLKYVKNTSVPENLSSRMIMDNDISEGNLDAQNSSIVFRALQNLTPYQARDERIWCALSHIFFKNYTLFRHKIKEANFKDQVKIRFFARGGQRSIERGNSISRLWWNGNVIENCREDNDFDELLFALCSNTDLRSQIIERPEISKIPQVVLAVLLCKIRMDNEEPNNDFFSRKLSSAPYLKLLIRISLEGGRTLLAAMSSEKLVSLFLKFIEEIRGR